MPTLRQLLNRFFKRNEIAQKEGLMLNALKNRHPLTAEVLKSVLHELTGLAKYAPGTILDYEEEDD